MTPELQNGQGTAIWRQIADTLSDEIQRGVLRPADKLPTEAELAGRFDVNRHTVRRAISELSERGLVRVERGRGMFVTEDVIAYSVGTRPRFTEMMSLHKRAPGSELLRAERIRADAAIAKALEIKRGAPVLLIERLGAADDRPVSIGRHHFPADRFPDLIAHYEQVGSITAALLMSGLPDYVRSETRVRARRATAYEAQHLRLPNNAPVLETEAINVDPEGRKTEFGISCFASNRVELIFEGDH